jgi:hypothetical protein
MMRIALSYRRLVVLKQCNHHYIDMAAAASVNNKLEEARRKLRPFSFDNLPLDRNGGIWTEFRNPPYSLDLEELSALKNARCQGNLSRPVKFIELLLFLK